MKNYLYHDGAKGMKWGKRRYQNADGTYTELGKRRRRADNMSDEDKANYVKSYNARQTYANAVVNSSRERFAKSVVDETGKAVNQFKQISDQSMQNSVKKLSLDLSNMSDKEMRDKINRELLERQYNSLFAPEVSTVSKGQKIVNNILTVAGSTLALGSSALAIALSVKQLTLAGDCF